MFVILLYIFGYMEIRNLLTFITVAETGSFTTAANSLGYTQPNVSAQIRCLESELGLPLFDRIGRSVYLTSSGMDLLVYARTIISTSQQMIDYQKNDSSLGGTINIGMVDSLFELFSTEAMLKYYRRFPNVHIQYEINSAALFPERLQKGRLDLALLTGKPYSTDSWDILYHINVPLVVIAAPDHPLIKKDHLSLKDLDHRKMVLMERSASYVMLFQNLLDVAEVTIDPVIRLQQPSRAVTLVQKSSLLSILPLYSVKSAADKGECVILNIEGLSIVCAVQLIAYAGKVITPQIRGLIEMISGELERLLHS